MTDREKAIVTAHTGINMLVEEKLNALYKYLSELYGRPVYTHEFLTLDIAEKSKPDFIELCRKEDVSVQPDGDAISRQTVLRCIKESREDIDWGQSEDQDAFLHYTGALYRTIASKECVPSVQPEQKTGKWILIRQADETGNALYECSECHKGECHVPIVEVSYCWNCGTKMEG